MIKKLNMVSSNFSHAKSSTWYKIPKQVEWDFYSKKNSISVYVDFDLHKAINDKNDGKLKFLWCLESPYFNNGVFDFIENNLDIILETFEQIWTYNIEHLKLNEKFKWVPAYGVSVDIVNNYNKTKKVSMITSDKQTTPLQKERFEFANKNLRNIDLYGRGFKPIESKNIGLNDYMFSIAIENCEFNDYFTEKILDCFATKTIPIYKGTKNISNYFNSNGIIFLDNDTNILEFNYDFYIEKLDYVQENFQKVLEFEILDDVIFNKHLIEY